MNISRPRMTMTAHNVNPNVGLSALSEPAVSGAAGLAAEHAGQRQRRDDRNVAGQQHHQAARDVPERRVVAQSFESRPVVGRRRAELVEHLREAVRTWVMEPREGRPRIRRVRPDVTGDRGADENRQGMPQERQARELHLLGFDFLTQELRRTADHHAGHEHGDDDEDEHVDEADADAAEDVVQPHADHRHQATERASSSRASS